MSSYIKISDYIYDCNKCPTRCDGKSKGIYSFENDASLSEFYENKIIEKINLSTNHTALKNNKKGYPDILITKNDGNIMYLEVKVQQRTFMQVEERLPESKLKPSETVALNLSDLKRYFEIQESEKVKIIIVWVVKNRLCLVPAGSHKLFYQDIHSLKEIFSQYGNKRRFKRKSGEGDVVGNVHKGVTVNYHFSINELILWENFNI